MRAFWCDFLRLKLLLLALFGAFNTQAQTPKYQVLDPRGAWPSVDRIPLSTRLPNLSGKRIYVIKSWAGGSGFDQTILDLAKALGRQRTLRVALDQVLCDEATLVGNDAEVAFFPPVTGG